MVTVPPRDPERVTDDPWDANAVRWLLGRPGGSSWTRGTLMECLRRQPNRLRSMPARVEAAARFAAANGVEQSEESRGGGKVVHLYRTDADAPEYPADSEERRLLLRSDSPSTSRDSWRS